MKTMKISASVTMLALVMVTIAACSKADEPDQTTPVILADMSTGQDQASAVDLKQVDQGGGEDMRVDMGEHPSLLEMTPEQCGACHTQHFDDWDGSMHAYATRDPIFQAMLKKGIAATEGKLDQFCIQCHAPVASKLKKTPVIEVDGTHTMPLKMSEPNIAHGVVCVTCHATTSVEATLNAEFTLTDTTLYGPTGSSAAQSAHPMQQSDLLTQSLVCGSCHNVVNPKGALLENTFSEWYAGPFNDGGEDDKTCQDCHMPAYEGEIVAGVRKTIHKHTFVGVDLALVEDFPDREEQRRLVEELLRSAAELDVERVPDQQNSLAIRATVKNVNNGHALPSGSTADRQVWVHLIVRDMAGEVVYESGMLDANGDLMDRVEGHSLDPSGDPELLLFGSLLFDEEGEHVTFPWEAKRSQDFLIQPGQIAWREYLIPYAELEGTSAVTVETRLLYRTFPPFLVRALIDEGFLKEDELPFGIPIVEMARETMMISL